MKRRHFLSHCAISFFLFSKNINARNLTFNDQPEFLIGKIAFEKKIFTHTTDFFITKDELPQLIKKDFETLNTIELDGWVLSRNEVKYCYEVYLRNFS